MPVEYQARGEGLTGDDGGEGYQDSGDEVVEQLEEGDMGQDAQGGKVLECARAGGSATAGAGHR